MSFRRVFERMTIALVPALLATLSIASGCSKGSSGGAQEAPTAPAPTAGDATATPAADAGAPSEAPAADAGTPSEAPGGDVGPLSDCDTSKVRCRRMPPQCAEGEAPTVEGSCFGPCVKIERCACSETVKCPNADKHTCWSNKHCGPYVR